MPMNGTFKGNQGRRGRDQQLGDCVTSVDIADRICVGDRVTILVPAGLSLRNGQEYREKTGRAVMRGPAGWVLNMGGKHGTPAIASTENIVRINLRKPA